MAEYEHRHGEDQRRDASTRRRYGHGGRESTPRGGEQAGQGSHGTGQAVGGATSGRADRPTSRRYGGQSRRSSGRQGEAQGEPRTESQGWTQGQMQSRARVQPRGPVGSPTVADVAVTDVVTVERDALVTEVVQRMKTRDVGSVVVVEGTRPLGIVTDRKVALALGETPDASRLRVTDVMSEDLFTVPENTSVFEVTRQLAEKGIRRVPVVSETGDLRGIVSLDDVFVMLAEEFQHLSEIVRKQSPRF